MNFGDVCIERVLDFPGTHQSHR